MSIKFKILLAVIFFSASTILIAQIKTAEPVKVNTPNYSFVFPEDKINTLKLKLSQDNWEDINQDMKSKFGEFGERKNAQGPGSPPNRNGLNGGGNTPPLSNGANAMGNDNRKPRPQEEMEPKYVAVSLTFNDMEMDQVGFRLKGNSSLMTSWGSGTYKLPFRLNFDKYQKQSLYGFKELSMSPAFQDNSLIREKVASDLFRDAGVPAARTSFCQVYIDFGNGSTYCGIYTIVEVVDDTMIKSQFGEEAGNIYKPESTFSSFSEQDFEKKNHKKLEDWSDVKSAILQLNSSLRKSDATKWRSELEGVFNVDGFIRWLAMNTLMTSWDSYGAMPHNYYLYNSPDKKLTWIPWDENEAMSTKKEGGMPPLPPPGGGPGNMPAGAPGNRPPGQGIGSNVQEGGRPAGPPSRNGVELSLKSVNEQWPLIKYVAEDPVYYAQYKNYVHEFSTTIFSSERMNRIFNQQYDLIDAAVKLEKKPYSQLTSYSSFKSELKSLKKLVQERNKAASGL